MPEGYQVDLPPDVLETILRLPERNVRLISARLARLERDPWAGDVQRLQGIDEVEFRVRAGDYRIVYMVDEERKIVLIKEVGLRRDVYRHR